MEQISVIVKVIESNPDVGQSVMNGILNNSAISSQKKAKLNSEEMPIELKKALDEFKKDPEKSLKLIAKEDKGAEKIALLEALFTQKDAATLEKKAKIFGDFSIPESAKKGIKTKVGDSKNGRLYICEDCKLHLMAGAGITMGISAAIYAGVTWLSWEVKAAMIIVVGISAGVLFGAAKELWDYKRNQVNPGSHGVEWKDFWYTTLGSFAGGAITFGITMVAPQPIIAFTAIAAGAIFLSWDSINCCVFNNCNC